MTEENAAPLATTTTSETKQTETVAPTAVTAAPQVAESVDWDRVLKHVEEKGVPRELRRHPKWAGYIGSEIAAAQEAERRRNADTEARRTKDQVDAEMESLLSESGDAIKERYPRLHEQLSRLPQERLQRALEDAKTTTRQSLFAEVGQAFGKLPEMAELDDADRETITKALAGRPDNEVLPLFVQTVAEVLVERRAKKRTTSWREKELAKEREALRREVAAELLAKTPQPTSTRPMSGPGKVDVDSLSPREFEAFWNTHVKR